jgi:hypothetical protein
MVKKAVPPAKTELSDEHVRQMFDVVADIVKDRLALAEHFRSNRNHGAAEEAQAEAFREIAKYLIYHISELKLVDIPDKPKKKRASKKSARIKT